MNLNSPRSDAVMPQPGPPIADAWGYFDPQRGSMSAVHPAVSADRSAAETANGVGLDPAPNAQQCPFCTESLPRGARHCPLCLREVPWTEEMSAARKATGAASSREQPGAVYTLEAAARCRECSSEIRTIRVLRVLRTQVSFTSTLPRKGYVILCPECGGMLAAELSGLI